MDEEWMEVKEEDGRGGSGPAGRPTTVDEPFGGRRPDLQHHEGDRPHPGRPMRQPDWSKGTESVTNYPTCALDLHCIQCQKKYLALNGLFSHYPRYQYASSYYKGLHETFCRSNSSLSRNFTDKLTKESSIERNDAKKGLISMEEVTFLFKTRSKVKLMLAESQMIVVTNQNCVFLVIMINIWVWRPTQAFKY